MKKYQGLTTEEALNSREKNGSNKLMVKEAQTLFSYFIDALKDKWIIVLFVALAIKLSFNIIMLFNKSFGTPDWYDVISILMAIIIATGFSSWSSYSNEQKFNALQDEASKIMVKVFRNNELIELMIDEIVVGDYVLVQQGDKIPADGIIVEGKLKVNQAALNGESEDSDKFELNDRPVPNSSDLFTKYKIFRGTVITNGEAIMKVTEVGDKTIFGSINESLQEEDKVSPSKEKLNKLADTIGVMGYSAGTIYFVLNLIIGFYHLNGNYSINSVFLLVVRTLIYSVTIIIMAVPEGLPMMTTLVAVINSAKLLLQKILLRHTETLETAGYLNILFSDKTGTITEGKLAVVDIILGNGKVFENIELLNQTLKEEIKNSAGINNDSLISEGKAVGSNGTDRCLLDFLISKNMLDFSTENIKEKEQFSSVTKYSSVTLNNGIKYIKGAGEILSPQCQKFIDKNGEIKDITPEISKKIDEVSEQQTGRSMRLIGLVKEENGIKILIGIVCIRDNVRQGMQKTVSNLNKAGVQVVMVTGDRKETAVAIAKDAGIISKETDVVLTHDELSKLSDEEVKKIIPNLKVVSRALPMDKKRLVNLGQSLGLVCGMTGDGINDSPSLKTADVGFSMGDGTEVAREASDIVILNNSLSSIEKAVLNGRTMTKSVQKFIIFQLTVNVATILISILSPLFGIEEPFSIVQILWINLIMDTLASLSFSEEPALDRYMKEQPVGRSENVLTKYMKTHIGTAAIFISIVSLAILNNWFNIHKIVGTDSAEQVRTFMFTFFIYAIIFNSLNTRSTGINVLEHITSNKKFIYIMGGIAIVQSLIIQFGGKVFSTVPMDLKHFGYAMILAFLIIPIDFIRKSIVSKK
jgi:calcium-translocating P-type ATPase, PMCA-type